MRKRKGDLYTIAYGVYDEIHSLGQKTIKQDLPFENELRHIEKIVGRCTNKVFNRLMDNEMYHRTKQYQNYIENSSQEK